MAKAQAKTQTPEEQLAQMQATLTSLINKNKDQEARIKASEEQNKLLKGSVAKIAEGYELDKPKAGPKVIASKEKVFYLQLLNQEGQPSGKFQKYEFTPASQKWNVINDPIAKKNITVDTFCQRLRQGDDSLARELIERITLGRSQSATGSKKSNNNDFKKSPFKPVGEPVSTIPKD